MVGIVVMAGDRIGMREGEKVVRFKEGFSKSMHKAVIVLQFAFQWIQDETRKDE